MTWAVKGLIEGFYGPPWSWERRAQVMRWCAERGMTHYIYAPKDDPLHRERWRDPYPTDTLDEFATLVGEASLTVGFAISPGLSIDYRSTDDRAALLAKREQVIGLGIGLVCLALDDIEPRPGLGADHAELTTWLGDRLPDDVALLLVPTEYTGTASTAYLDALAEGVPADVPIAWTGRTVVCDSITVGEARARAASLGDRAPLVWDNYPVNDALMADRMFLGPLRGRAPDLADVCSGYVANPMVQPLASMLPLSSTAAYLRGDDPVVAWQREAEQLGLRGVAEACDGVVPRQLVRAVVTAPSTGRAERIDELRAWLDLAHEHDRIPPDLRLELVPWLEQLERELGVMRTAVRLLRRLASDELADATMQGLALTMAWPGVRRGDRSVMGARCSVRPVFGQFPDGTWRFDLGAISEDENATDALVRFALQQLATASRR
jgi:hyaluronoglucosaminidase